MGTDNCRFDRTVELELKKRHQGVANPNLSPTATSSPNPKVPSNLLNACMSSMDVVPELRPFQNMELMEAIDKFAKGCSTYLPIISLTVSLRNSKTRSTHDIKTYRMLTYATLNWVLIGICTLNSGMQNRKGL